MSILDDVEPKAARALAGTCRQIDEIAAAIIYEVRRGPPR